MEEKDLIILPFHDYKKWLSEGFRTRDAHLFEGFKKHKDVNKILVINRPVSLAEMLIKRQGWKTKYQGKVICSRRNWQIVQVDENSFYLDMFFMDTVKLAVERKKWWYTVFNYKRTIEIINEACNVLNMNNRCVLLQNPMAVGVIGKLNENSIAFDAIDNWLHHPQNLKYKDLLTKNYKLIEEKSDYIFTVSKDLKNLFAGNKNVSWIANGVDKEFFAKSISNKKKNEKLTIGYVGKIQDRIDFQLVEECLETYKNYNFVFCGPILSCHSEVKRLNDNYNNISFLGDIHYNDLPEKMRDIDIAIIPHLINEFTNSMNPLKLYEYLAAGKQVVTTPVAGSESLSKYIYSCNNSKEFIDNIKKAIDIYLDDNQLANKVTDTIVEEYTWKSKCNQMLKVLNNN